VRLYLTDRSLDLALGLDRFTFYNNRSAFIELKSEEHAKKAMALLDGTEAMGVSELHVRPVRPEFGWGVTRGGFNDSMGWIVPFDQTGITTAVQPIVEGRRFVFQVKPPGWAKLDAPIKVRNDYNRDVVKRTLAPFGEIEALGRVAPNWGDLKQTPRFLCYVDMKTKQAADQAVSALHDTDVEGYRVGLRAQTMSPWKAYQLGQVDKEKLNLLQEKGLAPPPEEIDEERYAMPFVQKAKNAQRSGPKRTAQKH
jgi:hypothetical protein